MPIEYFQTRIEIIDKRTLTMLSPQFLTIFPVDTDGNRVPVDSVERTGFKADVFPSWVIDANSFDDAKAQVFNCIRLKKGGVEAYQVEVFDLGPPTA